jgi:hypothetical protein
MTAVGEPEVQSNIDVRDTPSPSPTESEARKVSDLRFYHFGQTNNDTPEENDNPISQVTQTNLEPGKEWKPHNQEDALKARRNSLLGNLRFLQARMSAHREKIGLLLAQFMDDPRLGDNQVRKRKSDELTAKSNNHRILVNLIKLDLGINSFAVLLEAPTIDLNLAFFTMAWLAVCQIKELESTTHEVFSDMENNSWSHRQRSLSVQAGIGLSKIGKAVNPQCVRMTTRLEQLGLEAKAPWQPGSMPQCLSDLWKRELTKGRPLVTWRV